MINTDVAGYARDELDRKIGDTGAWRPLRDIEVIPLERGISLPGKGKESGKVEEKKQPAIVVTDVRGAQEEDTCSGVGYMLELV